MRRLTLPLFALALALPAQAQSPHIGAGLMINLPTGALSQTRYPAYTEAGGNYVGVQTAGYDTGLGGYFTLSFPVDRTLAFRLNLNGGAEDGTNSATITPTVGSPYSDRQNLRHSMFSVGGDLQIFLQEGALRHSGTYLVAGISADFERFDQGYGDLYDYYGNTYSDVSTERKSRMGGNFGLGHSFGRGLKFNMEVTYHTTLTGKGELDPPAANMVRMSFGVVF